MAGLLTDSPPETFPIHKSVVNRIRVVGGASQQRDCPGFSPDSLLIFQARRAFQNQSAAKLIYFFENMNFIIFYFKKEIGFHIHLIYSSVIIKPATPFIYSFLAPHVVEIPLKLIILFPACTQLLLLLNGVSTRPKPKEQCYEERTATLLLATNRLHQSGRLPAPAASGYRRVVGRREGRRRMPIPPVARRGLGVAVMGLEGGNLAGERVCLRQILQRQGGIHRPRVVARFL